MKIPNWINGLESAPSNNEWLHNINPHNGEVIGRYAKSTFSDVDKAIKSASDAFPVWSAMTPINRGQILGKIVDAMKANAEELANCIAIETGKPPNDAKGEVGGSILQGEYFSSEGMRLYGRSLTSGMQNKYSHTVRQPRGIAGLIVPANTPIANISWKVFPALVCGNTVVLKAAEDSPEIAYLFAKITKNAGLPDGVLNVIQGEGMPAGSSIVEDPRVSVISFTGSTSVGRWIAEVAGKRLATVSLELGGKNPFIVCDDANIEEAVHWAVLSSFSNAGQRCAAASRIIVFKETYELFCEQLVAKTLSLKLGVSEGCDLGPVISEKQQQFILDTVDKLSSKKSKILCGGKEPESNNLSKGFYIEPTIIEGKDASEALCNLELFGPVTTIQMVENIEEALKIANATDFGLTSAIHTTNVDRAMWFAQNVKSGVVNINAGTYGSEPHMPFGGFGLSGNGTREPGVEALDVYSELKNISFLNRPDFI